MDDDLLRRTQIHAALGEAHRLAIVDELAVSDRSPSEVASMLEIDSNLTAHHIDVLQHLGIVERVNSQGDRRRRYLRLVPSALVGLLAGTQLTTTRIVFVCTENAARSQLAQAIWNQTQTTHAISGGLEPAPRLYPGAVRAAHRRGLDLKRAKPRPLPELHPNDLVITVCDRAHENLRPVAGIRELHWSVPDPATSTGAGAYETAAEDLETRIHALAPRIAERV